MSIGVARYDMVLVSKPSMVGVRIAKGKAHSRNGQAGAGGRRGAVVRAEWQHR